MASGATTNYSLPYPIPTDPVSITGDMEQLATRIDSILQEEIEDVTASVITGGTQVGMTAIYNDLTGKVDFTIVDTGTSIFDNITVRYDAAVNGGNITSSATSGNIFNSDVLNLNIAGSASAINIGSASGTLTIKNATTSLAGDLAVYGGDISSSVTTFNLINSSVTTLNIGGAATSLSIGNSSGSATINNASTVISGDLFVNGGDVSSTSSTVNLFSTSDTLTLNVGENALSTTIGASAGTTYFRPTTLVLNSTESGTPSSDAVIMVERGTEPNVDIRWNESTQSWQFTIDGSSYEELGGGGIVTSFFMAGM